MLISKKNPLYTTLHKMPRWTVKVSVFSDGDVGAKIVRKYSNLTKAEHIRLIKFHHFAAKRVQKLYSALLERAAQETWGRAWQFTDYRVSGIGSDEFSEPMKKVLRKTAWAITQHQHLSYVHQKAIGLRNYRKNDEEILKIS